jgi:TonB family protein
MSPFITYCIEANFGLSFFLGMYWLLLHKENQFAFSRKFLLAGIVLSALLPLFHPNLAPALKFIPSIKNVMPVYVLDEITTTGITDATPAHTWSTRDSIALSYFIVLGIAGGLFIYRVIRIASTIVRSEKHRWNGCLVAESDAAISTWSFFNFIFIGHSHLLSAAEKETILRHEMVHVDRMHSLDILLVDIARIIFWFNPLVIVYKNTVAQLHEFEADARSVENQDVDNYCGLLAKVALQDAGFSLVNHFNNSLTLKRIAMMKTLKKKIRLWKLVSVALAIPLFLFAVSCQEQLAADAKTVGLSSASTTLLPADIQTKLDALQKLDPRKTWTVIEMNEDGKRTLEKMKVENVMTGMLFEKMELVTTDKKSEGEGRTYVFLEKNNAAMIAGYTKSDSVYSVVEEAPEYVGGFDSLRARIRNTLLYPADARQRGVQGKVLISFIIDKNGQVRSPEVVKGIDAQCDKEALDVVLNLPQWIPGKQKGEPVNCKMVIPINFNL